MSLEEHAERPAVRWGASTDIGPVRSENEDSWLAVPPVFTVADGMVPGPRRRLSLRCGSF